MQRSALLLAGLLILGSLVPIVEAQAPAAPRCQKVNETARFFWHYQCVKDEFERLQKAYPNIAKYYEIGKSVENNPIYVLEVANFERQKNASAPHRPGFYYDATHHGNEIQGTESVMMLAQKLTSEYGKNASVTRWVDEYNIYLNPVVNPDGNLRDQRHNANGVDLNRNYPFQHGARASAAGPGGASEPEVKANVAFMRTKDLDLYLSAHTGTWDYVVPRCSTSQNRQRVPTDDEPLFEWVLAGVASASGMGSRGASGTGESICWAYDVVEVFSLLPEVSTEQNVPFSAQETTELNRAQQGVHWLLEFVGRYGVVLEPRLAANGTKPVVEIHNSGLQAASNWTLQLNTKDGRRAPMIRGNQPIPPGGNLSVSIPNVYLSGEVVSFVRYDHLNVDPRASDPVNGKPRDPFVAWLNFTAEQAQKVVQANPAPSTGGAAASPAAALAIVALAVLVLRRRT